MVFTSKLALATTTGEAVVLPLLLGGLPRQPLNTRLLIRVPLKRARTRRRLAMGDSNGVGDKNTRCAMD